MPNISDIKNIDDSLTDIYSIQEVASCDELHIDSPNAIRETSRVSLNEILTIPPMESSVMHQLRVSHIDGHQSYLKTVNEIQEHNISRLLVPQETKPINRLYGSTKHLFQKQVSMDLYEETPFLAPPSGGSLSPSGSKFTSEKRDRSECFKPPRHDSQESVQRIITERRQLDETLKELEKFDIFDISHDSEEHLVQDSRNGSKKQS